MSRRHTNAEIRAAIDALERDGWTINEDGTITRTQLQTRRLRHGPRSNAEPRYFVVLGRRHATIKVSDLVAAKFGLVGCDEGPDEAEVGLRLSFAPEMRSRPARVGCDERPDEVEVGPRLDFAPETCPEPAGRGPCGHCGGFMVRGDDNEHRCLQCGRANTPQRVLTAEESRWFRKEGKVGELYTMLHT